MAKEIVISVDKSSGTTRIALVEGGELAELHVETPQHERTLGDIALGRVKKVMPSIRAAFVDIGQQQDAFLHYSDLTDNLPQLLAFVAQDKPEIASIRIKRHVRLVRLKRHPARRRRTRRKKGASAEAALDKLFETRRRARAPRPQAAGKKSKLPAIATTDRPEECLQRDQRIIVKIVKEPISAKGSRVSTDISLAGRFLVLVPLADYVAVSKKVSSYKERRRLRALARSLVPDGFGVIVRTQAEGKKARDLDTDLRLLVEKWRRIEEKLQGKPKTPLTLHEDVNMVSSVIRDLFSDDYDRILVDDQKVYRNVKGYVQAVAPHMADAVQIYNGNRTVFEATGLHSAVREAFESRVSLPSGGYLFFERTEAMHVVDVNSGRSGRGLSQEENSLRVNIEAARVIARQMRLRDLGGIICVDFIDMRDEKNRRKIYDEFKKEFKRDRAVTKLLPMSDFGVVQITRQRLRPALTTLHTVEEVTGDGGGGDDLEEVPVPAPVRTERAASEAAPAERHERGGRTRERKPETPDQLIARMGQYVADYKAGGGGSPLMLRVHPFLGAFLNRRVPNWPTRWSFRHLLRIRVEEDASMSPFEFTFSPRPAEATVEDALSLKAAPEAPGKPGAAAAPAPPQEPASAPRARAEARSGSDAPPRKTSEAKAGSSAQPRKTAEPRTDAARETTPRREPTPRSAPAAEAETADEAPRRQRSRGGRGRSRGSDGSSAGRPSRQESQPQKAGAEASAEPTAKSRQPSRPDREAAPDKSKSEREAAPGKPRSERSPRPEKSQPAEESRPEKPKADREPTPEKSRPERENRPAQEGEPAQEAASGGEGTEVTRPRRRRRRGGRNRNRRSSGDGQSASGAESQPASPPPPSDS